MLTNSVRYTEVPIRYMSATRICCVARKGCMKVATVALVVDYGRSAPSLIDIISDDHEIRLLESAYKHGETDPLELVYAHRVKQAQEDDEFGNYVEELLSQPFVRTEIQDHGVQWLKSKLRIEQYQKSEAEAAKVIATYALKIIEEDRAKTDFFLAGPTTMVRVRVFETKALEKAA